MGRPRQNSVKPAQTDVLIVGGGVAGLWIHQRVLTGGFTSVLLEQDQLGGQQTGATQGIIHGGVKYALGGRLTGSREAIAGMPERWRRCLDGRGEVDLRGTRVLAEACHLWTLGSPASALASLLDHQALRGHVLPLARGQHPPIFRHQHFHGTVYRLNELVLDPVSLVSTLAAPYHPLMLQLDAADGRLTREADSFRLHTAFGALHAKHLILAAGNSNPGLLEQLGLAAPPLQRRPLHLVCVTLDHPEPIYGHCVTSLTEEQPELTVTSYPTGPGQWLLYLGGRLAETGAQRNPDQQIAAARQLMSDLLPWLAPRLHHWRTLRVDRVEDAADRACQPDTVVVHEQAGVIMVWPNKMSLVPELGDQVLKRLGQPGADSKGRLATLEQALRDQPKPALTQGILERAATTAS